MSLRDPRTLGFVRHEQSSTKITNRSPLLRGSASLPRRRPRPAAVASLRKRRSGESRLRHQSHHCTDDQPRCLHVYVCFQQRSGFVPPRCQRSTVAGWTRHQYFPPPGYNHRKDRQNSRSAGESVSSNERRPRVGDAGASVSSRRSRRGARPDRTAAPVVITARIACRVPAGDANVNVSAPPHFHGSDSVPMQNARLSASQRNQSGAKPLRRTSPYI